MGWKVIKRKIGRAGSLKQRLARQRDWDRRYGEGLWEIGYVIEGAFVPQEEALEQIYYRSYEAHFQQHPEDLAELMRVAKVLRNPHAAATTGVDLQVPAIMSYLSRHDLTLAGSEVLDIGSFKGIASHPLSIRLSPLHIKLVGNHKMTLEKFWQSKKCLAVWDEE